MPTQINHYQTSLRPGKDFVIPVHNAILDLQKVLLLFALLTKKHTAKNQDNGAGEYGVGFRRG